MMPTIYIPSRLMGLLTRRASMPSPREARLLGELAQVLARRPELRALFEGDPEESDGEARKACA